MVQVYIHNCYFFFNDTATTEIYTLSLHDALPIWTSLAAGWNARMRSPQPPSAPGAERNCAPCVPVPRGGPRSEEHTSEIQARQNFVCRFLLVKKKIQPLFSPEFLHYLLKIISYFF